MRYLIVLLLAGCTVAPVAPDAGKKFSVEHYGTYFSDAQEAAEKHCASLGLVALHLGTDRTSVGKAVSRFECVAK